MGTDIMVQPEPMPQTVEACTTKEYLYPMYSWEPRASSGRLAGVPKHSFELPTSDMGFFRGTTSRWSFGCAHWHAVNWYYRRITWADKTKIDPGMDKQTPWLHLALDYQASTGLALCKPDKSVSGLKLTQAIDFFVRMTRAVEQLYKCNMAPSVKTEKNRVLTLCALGLPPSSGYDELAILLNPEYVNTAIFKLRRDVKDENKPTLSDLMWTVPEPPRPSWESPWSPSPLPRRRLVGKQPCNL
eukprot:TRINITY_DN2592_c0_g1_i4.p1 TRINITY_DN2592_c0_g1~~TRINITY_DN2592_c0_g1_i4.p1  ORF type:complete len:243 (-),score=16.42 TRINITY_DN2592_c0_g1_i4:276-1004(-)